MKNVYFNPHLILLVLKVHMICFVLVQSRCCCSFALHQTSGLTDPQCLFSSSVLWLFFFEHSFLLHLLPRDVPVTVLNNIELTCVDWPWCFVKLLLFNICHSGGAWLSLFSQGPVSCFSHLGKIIKYSEPESEVSCTKKEEGEEEKLSSIHPPVSKHFNRFFFPTSLMQKLHDHLLVSSDSSCGRIFIKVCPMQYTKKLESWEWKIRNKTKTHSSIILIQCKNSYISKMQTQFGVSFGLMLREYNQYVLLFVQGVVLYLSCVSLL